MDPADPQAGETFHRCILNHELRKTQPSNRKLYEFYRQLLRLRRELLSIRQAEKKTVKVLVLKEAIREMHSPGSALALIYEGQGEAACVLLCPMERPAEVKLELATGDWEKLLDSAESRWGGKGSSLPGQLKSQGEVKLELSPFSASVWRKGGSPRVQRAKKG
jgi:maltooligosyltrehalose trehalohydrolase